MFGKLECKTTKVATTQAPSVGKPEKEKKKIRNRYKKGKTQCTFCDIRLLDEDDKNETRKEKIEMPDAWHGETLGSLGGSLAKKKEDEDLSYKNL